MTKSDGRKLLGLFRQDQSADEIYEQLMAQVQALKDEPVQPRPAVEADVEPGRRQDNASEVQP